MNKLQDIVDSSISFKLTQIADVVKTRQLIQHLGLHGFAREFSTIQLNLGRMAGHTTAIVKNSSRSDLIFTSNYHSADYLHRQFGKYAISVASDFSMRFRGRDEYYRYVWIDNASFIDKSHIGRVYDEVLGATKDYSPLFILMG